MHGARRLDYSNVVATLALFIALGGGAYATTHLSNNSVGTRQLKKGAVTTTKIANGAVTANKVNPKGLTVPNADTAGTARNATHATNAASASSPSTLASGKTEIGAYYISGHAGAASDLAWTGISFAFPLKSAPAINVIALGAGPTTACPGSVSSPSATPGNLCIYESSDTNRAGGPAVCDPVAGSSCGALIYTGGFGVRILAAAAGQFTSSGTWAVEG